MIKSHIPTVNTPSHIEIPIGDSGNAIASASKPRLKRGRTIGSKGSFPRKRKSNKLLTPVEYSFDEITPEEPITIRAVHRSKTGPDRTGTGLDRNRNHVFWRTRDQTGIIPVQTCPDLFIQVRSGFGPVWTCFVFFNICSLKSQNLHNKFSS